MVAAVLAFTGGSQAAPAAELPGAAALKRLEAAAGGPAPEPGGAPARRGGVDLEPCDEAPEGACGRVFVPLDRSDPESEEVGLFFEYYEHTGPGPVNDAVLVTLGGPGASVTQDPFFSDHMLNVVLAPLLETRDLIFLDQRGVGRSRVVNCPSVQHGTNHPYRDVRKCGEQLGPASSLYGTHDVALDIEAVRQALGIDQFDLYGGSYAAMDVQGYTARFPENVRSAVLDSPTTMVDFDPFYATSLDAVERDTELICERSEACSTARGDGSQDLLWLLERLRRKPVKGVGLDAVGDRHRIRVSEGSLIWKLLQADPFNFVPMGEIGAAADALRHGDRVPLLRLGAEGDGPLFADEGRPREFSAGANWARACTDEVDAPWDTSEPPSVRRQQWQEAADAADPAPFLPFTKRAWLAPFPTGPLAPEACVTWPEPAQPVTPPVPGDEFPDDVPALILSGDLDFITPTGDALKLTDAWPDSDLVEIANAGHHTAVTPRFECATEIIQGFITNRALGDTDCADDVGPLNFPGVDRFAEVAAAARPATVGSAKDESTELDRRIATVFANTVTDAVKRGFMSGDTGPGLRGGTFAIHFGNVGLSARLEHARFARNVAVNGRVRYGFFTEELRRTPLRVNGPGGHDGTLSVSGVWFSFQKPADVLRIQGKLGGRTIRVRVPAT